MRICAAEALGRIGPEAKEALPALRELSRKGSEALRLHAGLAVKKLSR